MNNNRCVCCGEIIPEGRQFCPNCGEKRVSEEEKTAKKRKDFLDCLVEIADYWKDKPDASFGAIFSTLVLFDGDNGLNDFERLEIKGISQDGIYLHDAFCERRRKYYEEKEV